MEFGADVSGFLGVPIDLAWQGLSWEIDVGQRHWPLMEARRFSCSLDSVLSQEAGGTDDGLEVCSITFATQLDPSLQKIAGFCKSYDTILQLRLGYGMYLARVEQWPICLRLHGILHGQRRLDTRVLQ